MKRRTFLATTAALAVPVAVHGESQNTPKETRMPDATSTWPNGARLAVSFSLMFEAGGQPISGAGPTCRRMRFLPTVSTKASRGCSICSTSMRSSCRLS